MELTHRFITAAIVAATTMATTTAFAQNRHEPHSNQDRRSGPAARSEVRPSDQRAATAPHAVPRQVPRANENHAYTNHAHVAPHAVRPYAARPYYYHPYAARPYYAYPYVARPYVFRPRTTLHFGIVLGYPVPYTYAYPYPLPVYGYGAPRAPIIVGPSSTQYGGVALEISPPDATVYVDGGYAGLVRDFDGRERTLTLAVGRHRIEISAPGLQPMVIDADVYPGQIVPYRGDLEPLRY